MAREKKGEISSRSTKSTGSSPEQLPTRESVLDLRQPTRKGSQDTQHKDQYPGITGSSKREAGVQSSTSATHGSSDLLWITTDRPADFKNAKIQKLISQHVMRDYQQKDQSGKESGRPRRKKSSHSSQSDEDFSLTSSTARMPIVERSEQSKNLPAALGSSTVKANQSSSLLREMYYPLSVDLDSFEFRQRLVHLIFRYFRVWFRDQASRLSGVTDYEAWEQWMPTILENETLLYAQAFYAVNHVNFLNPNAYKPERYVLKGHAIQKINEKLNDTEAAASDSNLSAVLCMASAAHLENLGATNYTMHMLGLQKMVAMRGGLQVLTFNPLLHESLCVCDILGTIIYRTELALLSSKDLQSRGDSLLQAESVRGMLDSPLYVDQDLPGHPKYSDLPSDIVQIMNALLKLTSTFEETGPRLSLNDSPSGPRFASLGLRLELAGNDPIYEACRLAGLIYFRALYHNVPFASPKNATPMRDLRASLQKTITEGWNGVPGLLVWALLVGTAAERTNTMDVFLAGHLSTTCLSLLPLGHDVAQILKHFLWLERVVEEKASRILEQSS